MNIEHCVVAFFIFVQQISWDVKTWYKAFEQPRRLEHPRRNKHSHLRHCRDILEFFCSSNYISVCLACLFELISCTFKIWRLCSVMAGFCRQTFTVDAFAIRYWSCRWRVCVCVWSSVLFCCCCCCWPSAGFSGWWWCAGGSELIYSLMSLTAKLYLGFWLLINVILQDGDAEEVLSGVGN